MTKIEFLTRLSKGLEARGVADAADILEEYEQHFAFKLADGYSEEEIAAKLGAPEALAAQFEPTDAPHKTGRRITAITGLCFADVFGRPGRREAASCARSAGCFWAAICCAMP